MKSLVIHIQPSRRMNVQLAAWYADEGEGRDHKEMFVVNLALSDFPGHRDVGLALLHPDPNYVNSLPTKMFEYMLMGRPVVVSNFPMWQEIVEEAVCGLAVDPLDLDAVESAVRQLLDDAELRQRLGQNGRRAVLDKYSWEREGEKLVDFYRELLENQRQ